VATIKAIRGISFGSVRLAACFAVSLSSAAPASAGDWSYRMLDAPATYTSEVGARIWYGWGRTGKNLYDDTGASLVSRLNYNDFSIFSGEGFGRFDFNTGWFLKGYAGGGALWDGRLKDEDFPPGIDPYSATLSPNKNSSVVYGSLDVGVTVVRGPDFHIGAFAGYHLMRQVTSAYGCVQIATNPDVCSSFYIPEQFKVITQVNNWNSLRVGFEAAVEFNQRWAFSVDAAWLPFVHLSGSDAHWLRIGTSPGDFTGPVPEDGNVWGYQVDAFLSYRVTDALSVGLGGRYWHMQSKGHTHFEGHVVGFDTVPQVLDWKTENYGVFFQASYKIGPYPVFGSN
jgi:hypothetical protein